MDSANKRALLSPTNFLAIFLAGFFLLLYLLTTNQIFSFDAVTNAIACETNEPVRWFHPNHLFYPALGVAYYRLETLFGYDGFSIYSLARLNSILMSAALGLFFLSLSRHADRQRALPALLFLGATYAVWHYAVDGRAVGASVVFSVFVISYLFRIGNQKDIAIHQIMRLSTLSYLATMMHAIAVFHTLAVGYFLWNSTSNKPENIKNFFHYLIQTYLLILVSYLTIYTFIIRSFSGVPFIQWSMGYAGFEGAGKFFSSPFWVDKFSELIIGLSVGWVRAFVNANSLLTLIVASVLSVGFLIVVISSFFKEENKLINKTMLLWGGLITIFLSFWSPGQEGFRLHVIVPWLAAATFAPIPRKWVQWFFGCGAAIIFCLNFSFAIYPSSFIKNNTGYMLLSELKEKLKPNDLFLSAQSNAIPGMEVLQPYFFPGLRGGTIEGRLFAFRESSLAPLFQSLSKIDGKKHGIYFYEDVFDSSAATEVEKRRGIEKGALKAFAERFTQEDFFALSNNRKIFRVKPIEQ